MKPFGWVVLLAVAGCGHRTATSVAEGVHGLGKPVSNSSPARPPLDDDQIAGQAGQKILVLTYHDIVPKRGKDAVWFDCTQREFEDQLTYIQQHHAHFISLDRLYGALSKGFPLPPKPVCITFADGYEGFYRYAIPFLRKHHIPVAMFVHTGFVGSPVGRPKMTWSQIKELDREVDKERLVTFGSQTVSHPEDLRKLKDKAIAKEFTESKAVLEKQLGHPIHYLAYPNGKFDWRCERAAKAAGYAMAFSEVTRPADESPSIYAVNRYVHTKWREAFMYLGWEN